MENYQYQLVTFSRYIQFQIGDRVKFWHDVWCGDNPLSMCFPDLFKISNDREAYVADLMQFPNGVLFKDLEFLRDIHDRELDSLFVFWNVIYGVSLRGIGEDKMCWTPAKSKGSKVSSYYQALLGVCTQSFPLEKYLEATGSLQSCIFCLDYSFKNDLDH